MTADVTADVFREAVSRFATGLTLVACRVADADHAMTASSFVALSLDPLLVSVSIERTTRFHTAVTAAGAWSVSILPEGSVAAARWFATKGRPLCEQLDDVAYHRGPVTGAALLDGALAELECRTWAVYPAGDHDLVVGEVVTIGLADDVARPLLYHRRRYRTVGPPAG